MLNWVKQFNIFCFLDNCNYAIQPQQYECVVAAAAVSSIVGHPSNDLKKLDAFIASRQGWCFGHLAYDLKNKIHHLSSQHHDPIGFPDYYFFQPEIVLLINHNELIIHAPYPEQIYDALHRQMIAVHYDALNVMIQSRLTKQQYLDTIQQLKQHIHSGDCYEINFCQEFFATDISVDAVALFQKLIAVSPNPAAALYRLDDKYLICASPERFITKSENKIISQPMKGTIRRSLSNQYLDDELKQRLYHSAKDRAENIMIVDLVRNDISKICREGSVQVEELYGIYSFPQVHQMISTISGELNTAINFSGIIAATFPMGSMTGAPKQRVMELIEQYEVSKRGIFSGSVGYIDAAGNFDFNVVIRSIMYNQTSRYLSYQVGSGITFYSDAEKEWEECLLKAEAIKKVLTDSKT